MEDPRTKAHATAAREVPRSSADLAVANLQRASSSDNSGWFWTDRSKAATSDRTYLTGLPLGAETDLRGKLDPNPTRRM